MIKKRKEVVMCDHQICPYGFMRFAFQLSYLSYSSGLSAFSWKCRDFHTLIFYLPLCGLFKLLLQLGFLSLKPIRFFLIPSEQRISPPIRRTLRVLLIFQIWRPIRPCYTLAHTNIYHHHIQLSMQDECHRIH